MEADALTDVGHQGFVIDAETIAGALYDFATHPEMRDAVKTEFTHIQGCVAKSYRDRKSTRLNSSHSQISYAVFCLKKKKYNQYLPLDHPIDYAPPVYQDVPSHGTATDLDRRAHAPH